MRCPSLETSTPYIAMVTMNIKTQNEDTYFPIITDSIKIVAQIDGFTA